MYDTMFIVHALEQSPVYWNFCTLIKAGVLYIFESAIILNENFALLQQVMGPERFTVQLWL